MNSGQRAADVLSRLAILVIVVAALVGVFGWYVPVIQENQRLQRELAEQEKKITTLSQLNQMMKLRKQNFFADSNTVERLARENLGYARPEEIVYRFEEDAPDSTANAGR